MTGVDSFLVILFVVLALGAGFAFGRRERRSQRKPAVGGFITGLGDALESVEKGDPIDLDRLLVGSPIEPGYADTLFGIASLVRRQGDMDAAIRIHQWLLSRSELATRQRHRAELELGRDYFSAGLLDRAEKLFRKISTVGGANSHSAQKHLLQIVERERDWVSALVAAEPIARSDEQIQRAMAHYCCELAEQSLARNELRESRRTLHRALDLDSECGRAELLLADVELAGGQHRRALRHLKRARAKSPWLVSMTLSRVRKIAIALADDNLYTDYLEGCSPEARSLGVVEELAEEHRRRGGEESMVDFLLSELERRPNVPGLLRVLRRRPSLDREELERVRLILEQLSSGVADFQCAECGVESARFEWQCASCRHWSSVRPSEVG